jgi:DNA-binding transcriptional LysR family regulator
MHHSCARMHSLPGGDPQDFGDLPFFLAMAEHGSLPAAARALGVNHSTVLRRIRAFETRLGARLFERRTTGHVLTTAGDAFLVTARQMREMLVDAERRIAGEDLRLEGTVRMTTTDTLAHSVLPRVLAGFAVEHPGLRVDLTTANTFLSLSRRDAEVALRPSKEALPSYVGRRVAEIAFALYAAPSYLDRIPARTDLERHVWLGLDESLDRTTIARWMAAEIPRARLALRVDSLTALAHAAAGGVGVAALPCYLGDGPGMSRALRRIRGPVHEMVTELWILTHEDLKRTARIRAVTDWLADHLGKEHDLFVGRRPGRT